MKKIFLNLLLVQALLLATSTLAFAASRIDGAALGEMRSNQCIELGTVKNPGPDNGYIITIIEEPLNFEASDTKTPASDFESRICYRNTLVHHTEEEQTVQAELRKGDGANGCSSKAEALANANPETYSFYCQQVQVLLSKGGTSLIEGYISTIYNWAFGIVGLISVMVIIISAAQISLGAGDTQSIDSAKTRIIKSLSGIVVLALAGLILYTINPNFFIK